MSHLKRFNLNLNSEIILLALCPAGLVTAPPETQKEHLESEPCLQLFKSSGCGAQGFGLQELPRNLCSKLTVKMSGSCTAFPILYLPFSPAVSLTLSYHLLALSLPLCLSPPLSVSLALSLSYSVSLSCLFLFISPCFHSLRHTLFQPRASSRSSPAPIQS